MTSHTVVHGALGEPPHGGQVAPAAGEPSEATPRSDGFAMPAEWAEHQLTLVAWPCHPAAYRRAGAGGMERAEVEYASVANAVSDFEPVLMLVRPDVRARARRQLAATIDLLEVDLDDAWIRDNGPIFVTDSASRVAMVHFAFNGWGGKFPSDRDGRVAAQLASHFGVRRYVAPMVLEGGSFFVDGEGTLVTTEQCLLNPNRNPLLSREQIELTLGRYLGVDSVIWLGERHFMDPDTDGHVDCVAQFSRPGRVVVHAPSNRNHPDHDRGRENVERLRSVRDARGRSLEVVTLDTGTTRGAPNLNCYLCNGAVIAPVVGLAEDTVALELLQAEYPTREVVPVPATAILTAGGGPHCITQQVPAGTFVT